MPEADTVIFIVDDDPSVRKALRRLIRSLALHAEVFASAREFLERPRPDVHGCVVLDVRMPGLTGLDLQREMATAGIDLPIVFLTGHGDVPTSVEAMKGGAIDFLEKPVDDDTLLDAIDNALRRDKERRREQAEISEIQQRAAQLTPREREVFEMVVTGMLNKQVAFQLGISEKKVKVHRARVMQKMEAESLAELVRLAAKLGVSAS